MAPLADTMPGRLRISAQKLRHPVWNSNRRVVDSTLKVCVEEICEENMRQVSVRSCRLLFDSPPSAVRYMAELESALALRGST